MYILHTLVGCTNRYICKDCIGVIVMRDTNTIHNAERKYIVKKAVRQELEEADGDLRPGTPEYADLMQNIEGQVQRVIEANR